MENLFKNFANLSAKELGKHLNNFLILFTKPLQSWKSSISYRKTGYDFVIQNIIYYFIFICLTLGELRAALVNVSLELLYTIIPFIIVYPGYKLIAKQKRLKGKHLFRLLIIVKIQSLIPLALIGLIAGKVNLNLVYNIYESLIFLTMLPFVIVPPVVFKTSTFSRIAWGVTNYLLMNIVLLISVLAVLFYSLQKEDLINVRHDDFYNFYTPNSEIVFFQVDFSSVLPLFHSNLLHSHLETDKFLMEIKRNDSKFGTISDFQYVNAELYDFLNKNGKQIDEEEYRLKCNVLNNNFRTALQNAEVLNKTNNNALNKEYFKLLIQYLSKYRKAHQSKTEYKKFLNDSSLSRSYFLGENKSLVLFLIDSTYYEKEQIRYHHLNHKLLERRNKLGMINRIIYFPTFIFITIIDSLTDKSKFQ